MDITNPIHTMNTGLKILSISEVTKLYDKLYGGKEMSITPLNQDTLKELNNISDISCESK